MQELFLRKKQKEKRTYIHNGLLPSIITDSPNYEKSLFCSFLFKSCLADSNCEHLF